MPNARMPSAVVLGIQYWMMRWNMLLRLCASISNVMASTERVEVRTLLVIFILHAFNNSFMPNYAAIVTPTRFAWVKQLGGESLSSTTLSGT